MAPIELTDHTARLLIDQQNLVRGTISRLRPSGYHEGNNNFLSDFRMGLSRDLLAARSQLPEPLYDEYLQWVLKTVNSVVPQHSAHPIGGDYLRGLIHKPSIVPLSRELVWIAKRVAHDASN